MVQGISPPLKGGRGDVSPFEELVPRIGRAGGGKRQKGRKKIKDKSHKTKV